MATEGQEPVYAMAEGLVAEGLWKWPKGYKSGRGFMKMAEVSGTKSAEEIW